MKANIKKTIFVILGNIAYPFAIALFIEPAGLIMGGSTGIGLFANNIFHLPTSFVVAVLNTVLFLVGWKVLGRLLAANTLLSTIVFPIALNFAERCAR